MPDLRALGPLALIGTLVLSPIVSPLLPPAVAQTVPGLPDILTAPTTWQWAVRESVSWVLILVLLFFYRRDWLGAVDYWKEQNRITAGLVEDTTKALAEVVGAVRENATVTHSLKRTLEVNLPLLRRADTDLAREDRDDLPEDRTAGGIRRRTGGR